MRSIFAAMIIVSASIAVVHSAEVQKPARSANQIQFDKKSIEKDNELLDLPATEDKKIIGADQLQSEHNALAKTIEQENARDDRAVRGICGGC
jgi:hypothetical protein